MRPCFTRFHRLPLLALIAPAFAWAQQQTPPAAPGVSAGSFAQGLVGLLLIIALLLGTLYLLKRYSSKLGGVDTAGLKVLAGLSVGARERILLIEVGEQWLVVGVTTSNIRTLHSMPKGSLPDAAAGTGGGSHAAFAGLLSRLAERKTP